MLLSHAFLLRTLPDGRREISWRVWVLVWVLPVLFLIAALLLAVWEGYRLLATVPATGEVVRVYSWPGDTPFDRGATNYSPVFRYNWSDGQMTEASSGASHPDWNLAVGSQHEIRYFPDRKTDILLPGPHNWFVAAVISAIGALAVAPAALASRALLRWRARGAAA